MTLPHFLESTCICLNPGQLWLKTCSHTSMPVASHTWMAVGRSFEVTTMLFRIPRDPGFLLGFLFRQCPYLSSSVGRTLAITSVSTAARWRKGEKKWAKDAHVWTEKVPSWGCPQVPSLTAHCLERQYACSSLYWKLTKILIWCQLRTQLKMEPITVRNSKQPTISSKF